MSDMRRREFITLLAGAAAAWPLAARAQQGERMRRVGILMPYRKGDAEIDVRVRALRQELGKLGWTDGANVQFDERWPADDMDRVRSEAATLIASSPDAIIATGGRVIPVLTQLTRSIPIVVPGSGDPLGVGWVTSLARPGGNVTGLTVDTGPEIAEKMLQLLKEAAPRISRVAVLLTTRPVGTERRLLHDGGIQLSKLEAAAERLGITLQVVTSASRSEFEDAFAVIAAGQADALFVSNSAVSFLHRRLILEFALKRGIAGVYPFREFAEDGGLLTYGVDLRDMVRRSTIYLDRILKGARPGDLPVEQPTKFELLINLKTARALGLTIPPSLLQRADQVIE